MLLSHQSPRSSSRPLKAAANTNAYILIRYSGRCRQQKQTYRPSSTALSTAAITQPFDALASWLSDNGGSVGRITAGDCVMGDVTVRGLVALEDLEAGTPVISVPISSTVRDDRVPEAYRGMHVTLCECLLLA
eukprot:GHUV01046707.1.p1 GENE.GHUV01046707.1~~GHUV01046707.1.p1  ORF type:complete len:133 (-),score=13.67 GHUV01046707.1:166-564(-)